MALQFPHTSFFMELGRELEELRRSHSSDHERMKKMVVTPIDALFLLEHCRYDRQRPIDQENVLSIARSMRNRTYTNIDSVVNVAVPPWRTLAILNGYHRLKAIIESGCASYPLWFCTFKVNSEKELADIYNRQDVGKPRTIIDSARAFDIEGLLKEEDTDEALTITRLYNALSCLGDTGIRCTTKMSRDPEEKKKLAEKVEEYRRSIRVYSNILEEYLEGLATYHGSILGSKTEIRGKPEFLVMVGKGVLSIFLALLQHGGKKGEEFTRKALSGGNNMGEKLRSKLLKVPKGGAQQIAQANTVAFFWEKDRFGNGGTWTKLKEYKEYTDGLLKQKVIFLEGTKPKWSKNPW